MIRIKKDKYGRGTVVKGNTWNLNRIKFSACITFCILLLWFAFPARAVHVIKKKRLPVSYICIEAKSGIVLAESNADLPRPPASMIKLMEMLMVTEGLEAHKWTLDTPIMATRHAQAMGGTQVYLEAGETHSLGELMQAVAVASANDAAMAVAEGLWGSADAYIAAINKRARELGMKNSLFHSVHGLPPSDGKSFDRTTARDMSILAQHCVQKPQILKWTSLHSLRFRPEDAVKFNTNKLLFRMADCDGLKTGYIYAAGFCVTATAKRNGIRLIVVVMGADNSNSRFALAQRLLEEGFKKMRRIRYLARGQAVNPPVPVRNCEKEEINLVAARDAWVAVPESEKYHLTLHAQLPDVLNVPVAKGTVVGEAQVLLHDRVLDRVPLVVPRQLNTAGWCWKLEKSALHTF